MEYVVYKVLNFFGIIALGVLFLTNNLIVIANFDIAPYNDDKSSSEAKNWFILKGQPGQKLTDSFRISNNSKDQLITELNTKDVQVLDDGSLTIITDQSDNQDAGNWLKLDVKKVTIGPNQYSKIPLSIQIPKDAKDGEYAAGVSVSQINPETANNVQSVVRKALRTYIQVGSDFKLRVNLNNLNIIDPKDSSFEDLKNKKPYFGRDNLLLEFEAENSGNVFGVLEVKYALKYENGEVFEGNFNTEIVPNIGKRKYYIITNQGYKVGTTEAILDYQIKPLNVDISKVKIEKQIAVSSDKLSLSQSELDSFAPAKTKAFIKPGESASSETKISDSKDNLPNWLKVVLVVVGVQVVLTGVGVWYFLYRRKKSKSV
ncbi:MAG: DUF916 domain-containing protein [bacterium]